LIFDLPSGTTIRLTDEKLKAKFPDDLRYFYNKVAQIYRGQEIAPPQEIVAESKEEVLHSLYLKAIQLIQAKELPVSNIDLRNKMEEVLPPDENIGDYLDDMYDAIEGAVNTLLKDFHQKNKNLSLQEYLAKAKKFENLLVTRLRSLNIIKLQQFSTPLTISEIMVNALNPQENEVILEPTAGTGNLIAPITQTDRVIAMEIDKRRADVLRFQGYNVREGDYMAETIKVNSIIMNPPWGFIGTGKYAKIPAPFHATDISQKYIAKALNDVVEGGRVVALMPENTLNAKGFLKWLGDNHTVVQIGKFGGELYKKRGTDVGSVMFVIDKGKLAQPEEIMPSGKVAKMGMAKEELNIIEISNLDDIDPEIFHRVKESRKPVREVIKDEEVGLGKPGKIQTTVGEVVKGVEGAKPEEPGRRRPVGVGKVGEGIYPTNRGGEAVEGIRRVGIPEEGGVGRELGVSEVIGGHPGEREAVPLPDTERERGAGIQPRIGRAVTFGEAGHTRGEPDKSAILASGNFVVYSPLSFTSHDLESHPAPSGIKIVEASNLANVSYPAMTYVPSSIIKNLWNRKDEEGNFVLYDVQLEAITLTRQAHINGHTTMIADGAGIGKTRTLLSIMVDELESEHANRYVYVVGNEANIEDVLNEYKILCGDKLPFPVINLDKPHIEKTVIPLRDKTIYFITKDRFTKLINTKSNEEIEKLGFDSWVFDECHKLRGEDTKGRNAWNRIHGLVENDHFLYASATPAKSLTEMEYLYALYPKGDPAGWNQDNFDLWIKNITGKTYAKPKMFQKKSVASFVPPTVTEQILKEFKMKGKYISREIALEDVEYEMKKNDLSPEQKQVWNGLVAIARKTLDFFEQYKNVARKSNYGTMRSQMQNGFKNALIQFKIKPLLNEVNKLISEGKKVVIFTNYINTRVKTLFSSSVEQCNTMEYIKDTGEQIPISLAVQRRQELLDEINDFVDKYFVDDFREYIKNNIKGKIEFYIGKTSEKNRNRIAKEFREGKIDVLFSSKAGKTAVSFHDTVGSQHILIDIDPEYSVTDFFQELYRVMRAGQKTTPAIKIFVSDIPGENKLLTTLGRRLEDLGAASRGTAEITAGEAFGEYELIGELSNFTVRQLWYKLSAEERSLFKNNLLYEYTPQGEKVLKMNVPLTFTIENFLFDLWLMYFDDGQSTLNAYKQEYKDIMKDTEEQFAWRARKESGHYVRSIDLTDDLTLREVVNEEGKKQGILVGMISDKMNILGPMGLKQYINFTTPEGKIVGLYVGPGLLGKVANEFGKKLETAITIDNAFQVIMAGDEIPLVGDLTLRKSLDRDSNQEIVKINNAKMKDMKRLQEAGGKYNAIGNKWYLTLEETAVKTFITNYPIRQFEEVKPEKEGKVVELGMAKMEYAGDESEKINEEIEAKEEKEEKYRVGSVFGAVRIIRDALGSPPIAKKLISNYGLFAGTEGTNKARIMIERRIAGDLELLVKVLTHEIGHWADWIPDYTSKRGNIIGRIKSLQRFFKGTFGNLENKELKTELIEFSKFWFPYNEATTTQSYIKKRRSSTELYADAISGLLIDPDSLKNHAPKFWEAFWDNINKKPEVKEEFEKFTSFINSGDEEIGKEILAEQRAMFKRGDERFATIIKEAKEAKVSLWRKILLTFRSRQSEVIRKVQELEKRGIYLPDEENPHLMLERMGYLPEIVRGMIAKLDKEITRPMILDGITIENLGVYLFNMRVMNGRAFIANPLGTTRIEAPKILEALKKELGDEKYETLKEYADKFYAWTNSIVEGAIESGFYSRKRFEEAKKKDPYYATYFVVDYLDTYVFPGMIAQHGTFKDITNPFDATVLKMYYLKIASEKNRAKLSVAKMFEIYFRDEVVIPKKNEDYYITTIGEGVVIKNFRKKEGYELLEFYRNGTKDAIYVNPYVSFAVKSASTGELRLYTEVMETLLKTSFFKKLYVGYNLGFQTFNYYFRDFFSGYFHNPVFNPLKHALKYFKGRLHAKSAIGDTPDDVAQEIMERGAGSVLYQMFGIKDTKDLPLPEGVYDWIKKTTGLEEIPPKDVFQAFFKFLENKGKIDELTAKLVGLKEWKGYNEKLKAKGEMPLTDEMINHYVRIFSGSPNFRERGAGIKYLNPLILFLNPPIQGWYRWHQNAIKTPKTRGGYWLKFFFWIILPKLVMKAIEWGLMGTEKKEWMEEISEYNKAKYHCYPLTKLDDGTVVYIRFPMNDEERMLGSLFWIIMKTDMKLKEKMETMGKFLTGEIPSTIPAIQLISAWFQYIVGQNPYDFFMGRPVLTFDEQAGRKGRLSKREIPAAKKMVKWTVSQFGLSAMWTIQERDKTWVKTIKMTPVLSRYLRFAKGGEEKTLREYQEEIRGTKAQIRLKKKEILEKSK